MYISYSAIDTFVKCPFSFKLKYVDKVPYDKGTIHTAFGNSIHKTIQTYLLDKNISVVKTFKEIFKQHLKELPEKRKLEIFKDQDLKKIANEMISKGHILCEEAIKQLEIDFPGFEVVSIEQKFIEPIIEYEKTEYEFKGVIDIVIKTPDGKFHILDWKTCSWGWDARKKNNKMVTYQLTFYKHFFSLQSEIDLDNISTHFALLKRTAQKDEVEIFEVPVGPKKIRNALNVLNNMLYNVDKKMFIKNRLSCKYCDFHETVWCP